MVHNAYFRDGDPLLSVFVGRSNLSCFSGSNFAGCLFRHWPSRISNVCKFSARHGDHDFSGLDTLVHPNGGIAVPIWNNGRFVRFNRQTRGQSTRPPIRSGRRPIRCLWRTLWCCHGRGRDAWAGHYARHARSRLRSSIAAGLIIGGASLAPIIPPSLLAIIVGSLADVSIAKLLIAGVIPGLFISGVFLVYIFVRISMNPSLAPGNVAGERAAVTAMEKLIAILRTLPFLIVIFSVMGFIMLGIATPSESAATGVVGSLFTAAIYRKLSFQMIWDSLMAAITVSAMILAIMAMSKMFTQLLAFTGATGELVNLVANLGYSPIVMLFIMLAVPFILCMFIDTIAVILLTIPIYQPVVTALEFDPVWFWLLFLVNITLGAITPPFGYTLFAFKAVVPDMSISQVYRATWPFVGLFLLGIALIIAFPGIATWLPNLIG